MDNSTLLRSAHATQLIVVTASIDGVNDDNSQYHGKAVLTAFLDQFHKSNDGNLRVQNQVNIYQLIHFESYRTNSSNTVHHWLHKSVVLG
ncbi:hypothetical protein D3C71_2039090 [compost metagenome]